MSTYNKIEQNIVNLYQKINVGKSNICIQCNNINTGLYKPVSVWLVGSEYSKQEKRILFLGKNARGECDVNSIFQFEYSRKNLWNSGFPFWTYTKEISKQIFNTDSCEYIAATNMVKCNSSMGQDTTSQSMKDCCINKMKVLKEEIKIINPTHIIIYTAKDYDDYIFGNKSFFDSVRKVKEDISFAIGDKKMPYTEAVGIINSKEIKVLRVGHPERKYKQDFVKSIVDFIKNN